MLADGAVAAAARTRAVLRAARAVGGLAARRGRVVAAAVRSGDCGAARARDLVWLVAAFGPYFAFDLLFQEMVTTRYALPLVVPTAFLAVRGLAALPRPFGMSLAVCAVGGEPAAGPARRRGLRARQPRRRSVCWPTCGRRATAPLAKLTPLVPSWPCIVVRSSTCAGRRAWAGGFPPLTEHLPAPPKHEWLELVKYWNRGGRAPIWFIADPPRSDLALVDRHAFAVAGHIDGRFADRSHRRRPAERDGLALDPGAWLVSRRGLVTYPETAGVARDEGRGPGRAPIQGLDPPSDWSGDADDRRPQPGGWRARRSRLSSSWRTARSTR